MARFKMCVCGKKSLAAGRDLCAGCLSTHGADKDRWPEWLVFAIKDTQRLYDHDRSHDDMEQWDTFVYEEKQELPLLYKGARNWKSGESDDNVDFKAALSKLSKNQRTALTLRSEGYTHQEVAGKMGVSLRSAKQYSKDANELIQSWLE